MAMPMDRMLGRWLGPMPRRKRPGANWATTWACCAITRGWRGKMGTIDVPNLMLLVRPAAAAITVMLSNPAPPVVIHTAGMPAASLRRILASAWSVLFPLTSTPIKFSAICPCLR